MAWRTLIILSTAVLIFSISPLPEHLLNRLRSFERLRGFEPQPKRYWDEKLGRYSSHFWKPGDPCPTEIHGVPFSLQPYGAHVFRDNNFDSVRDIHEALLRCDAVQGIYLRIPPGMCLGEVAGFTWPLNPTGDDRYLSAPKIVSLGGYGTRGCEVVRRPLLPPDGWMRRNWVALCSWVRWQSSTIPRWKGETKSNFELWLDAMDFSQVHTLHLNSSMVISPESARLLAATLPRLETLIVDGHESRDFLLNLPPNSLKHLTWNNMHVSNIPRWFHQKISLIPIFQHHGASLLSLALHADETPRHSPPSLATDDIQQLAILAPNLENLTLNLGRHKPKGYNDVIWPWDTLKLIATGFPELTHLTVYFPLASPCRRANSWRAVAPGCEGVKQYWKPILTVRAAREMAEYLARHKKGRKLEAVTVRSGDWEEGYKKTLGWAKFGRQEGEKRVWFDGKKIWVHCVLEEGEEGRVQCNGGDTLGLGETDCWDEYRFVGFREGEGIGVDWWDRVCFGDEKKGEDAEKEVL
ncbi:hypothetical protein QBC34DRAFT_438139 [Podospora aff. communis PSN243]|uniref:Uncharacterized protein n=1 Tax=Podospora aff. communis PSN243 TaxID=3040156 RepID=A0AAV9GNX4_9PEZI|nr:hypothetical protein QBC34DRAFT_438139 [Podospora aff. communis PSN243]